MKKITIFVRNGCSYCDALLLPADLNVEKVYVDSPDYAGHIPGQVPALQISEAPHNNPLQANGTEFINQLLTTISEAKDGIYNK